MASCGMQLFPPGRPQKTGQEGGEQAFWIYLWYCQAAMLSLSEGRLTRLNRKLSFTPVFGTLSYVLQRWINIVLTKVPLSPFWMKILADDAELFLKARTAALKLNCLYLKGL